MHGIVWALVGAATTWGIIAAGRVARGAPSLRRVRDEASRVDALVHEAPNIGVAAAAVARREALFWVLGERWR